jgi:hypothetical protein
MGLWETVLEDLVSIKLEREVITPEAPELTLGDLELVGITPRDPVLGLGMVRQMVDDRIHEMNLDC